MEDYCECTLDKVMEASPDPADATQVDMMAIAEECIDLMPGMEELQDLMEEYDCGVIRQHLILLMITYPLCGFFYIPWVTIESAQEGVGLFFHSVCPYLGYTNFHLCVILY